VGDLSGTEDIVVNGRFQGKIRVERTVTVGAGGELDGDIAARSVVVGGKVRGQIMANEKAELLESAIVEGSVQAPKIVIAEGAQLEGNVAMSGSKPGAEEK
jgi:cytoskeletal protein CcmA (bactofilin family)